MPVSGILRAVAAVVLLVALAAPGLAQARWLRAESPRFIVYSDGSESQLRRYVEQLEVFDSLLRVRHGLPESGVPARKLPIYLVGTREELQLTWHKASDGVAGYYHPGTAYVFGVAVLEGDTTTLMHEYTHHFMLANFPGAYPAWMVEGYAEFYSNVEIKDDYVEIGAPSEKRAHQLMNEPWMPIADVLANKKRSNGRDVYAFYAESWLLTHYMMSTPERFKQFQAYAQAVGKGGDPIATMETVTGTPIAAFDKAVRKYSTSQMSYVRLKRTDFAKPPITITTLPPSADALLLERLQLVRHGYKEANAGYLDMVRSRAARFPGDQLALLSWSQAELELGDTAKGRQLIDDWIKAHPDDVEARFVVGHFLIWKSAETEDKAVAAKMLTDAGEYLKVAAQLAPNDYRVLYAYAQTRRTEPSFPTVETQALLVNAYKQAPQVVPLRFELIQVLMARRNWPQAEALLRPLVNNPHGGTTVEKARELMKRVQDARGSAQ